MVSYIFLLCNRTRNLHTRELEDFLYNYTIALHNFEEINAPYSELIEQANTDREKYYQKKITDFEEWKQSKNSQNLYDVENNKIPVLEKNVTVCKRSLLYY